MAQTTQPDLGFEPADAETSLARLARACYERGWVMGTSGNFSAVVSRVPLVVTITATGLDKGTLSPESFVHIDANGATIEDRAVLRLKPHCTCFWQI